MSHEKVKSIRFENGKVFITSKCNNDTEPPREWNCTFISEILQKEGETAAIISILGAYESGNFQAGTPNKYSRAIDRLRYLPEYQKYNWRNKYNGDKEHDALIEANRQSEDFKKLLLNSLNLNPPKTKIIISKQYGDEPVYILKVTARRATWTPRRSEAKVFKYEQDAEKVKSTFIGGENFKTIAI